MYKCIFIMRVREDIANWLAHGIEYMFTGCDNCMIVICRENGEKSTTE